LRLAAIFAAAVLQRKAGAGVILTNKRFAPKYYLSALKSFSTNFTLMKRLLFYAALALAFVWAFRALEYEGVRRCNLPEFVKLRKTFLEKNDAQLLLLGSSRTACQFVPEIIEKHTGLKTWNAGMTGSTLPFFRATLEAWLVNNPPPKAVVINLDIHALNDTADPVFDYPRYLPYLGNEALYNGLKRHDAKFAAYRYIAPYCLAQGNVRLLNASLRGWFGTTSSVMYYGGYEETVKRGYSNNLDSMITAGDAPLPSKTYLAELNSLLQFCKTKNIKPVLVLSPLYALRKNSIGNYQLIVMMVNETAKKNGLPLIDISVTGISYNPDYYADPAHLTRQGAEKFSELAGMNIADYLTTTTK
jgi:hypothetical protein